MAELRNQMHMMEVENERLTLTMREMVESYTTQLELRDENIRRLEQTDFAQQSEVAMLIQKENEALKQENKMMRDKVHIIEQEL